MAEQNHIERSRVIPGLRYRDAAAAIDWLTSVLGFQLQLVVPGSAGQIVHAQLRLGGGMIMLSSIYESDFGRLIKQPDETGGAESQAPYLVVDDADAVYARAKSAGAEILIDIQDESYGGRGFTCRDPGGHIWSVGTYDPWAEPA
jgi:uncharacterized glyoxalase superfamily protein PhnB